MRRALVIALAALAGCGGQETKEPADTPAATPAGKVIDVDDRSYERLVAQADGPVLVLFWAPWSGPDRVVMPYFEEAARERPGLTVAKINVDEAPDTASRHGIMSIPTSMVLVKGEQRGEAVNGAAPEKLWEEKLDLDALAPRR